MSKDQIPVWSHRLDRSYPEGFMFMSRVGIEHELSMKDKLFHIYEMEREN